SLKRTFALAPRPIKSDGPAASVVSTTFSLRVLRMYFIEGFPSLPVPEERRDVGDHDSHHGERKGQMDVKPNRHNVDVPLLSNQAFGELGPLARQDQQLRRLRKVRLIDAFFELV